MSGNEIISAVDEIDSARHLANAIMRIVDSLDQTPDHRSIAEVAYIIVGKLDAAQDALDMKGDAA